MLTIGVVIIVVTIAITSRMVNIALLMTPASRPTLMTMSSIMPRAFISEPMVKLSRQF